MIQCSDNFRSLYVSKAPDLIRFAFRFVDRYSAEDIVQDAFLKLLDDKYQNLEDEDLIKLLYTFVRNLCIDHIRHEETIENYRDKRILDLTIKEIQQLNSFEKEFIKNDLYQFILSKIELLPQKRKEVFELSYLEGKRSSEIADMLGLSIRTVENNLYRALVFLREQLPSNLYALVLYFITNHFFK